MTNQQKKTSAFYFNFFHKLDMRIAKTAGLQSHENTPFNLQYIIFFGLQQPPQTRFFKSTASAIQTCKSHNSPSHAATHVAAIECGVIYPDGMSGSYLAEWSKPPFS
jgi:hypothetical protein